MTDHPRSDELADEPTVPEPLAATAQHIELLHNKRARLLEAVLDAEQQYVQAVWREHRAGQLDWRELIACYERLRSWGLQGYSRRWLAVIPYDLVTMRRRAAAVPDLDGTWKGPTGWPLPEGSVYPIRGVFVVYVLLDENLSPIYVGSTQHFRERMKRHHTAGKRWSSWVAYPCESRKHAYEIETRFLRQYQPSGNRTRSAGGGVA